MKNLMMTVLTLFAGISCCLGENGRKFTDLNRTSIGTDIASGICFSIVRMSATHLIDTRWSVGFDVGINLNGVRSEKEVDRIHSDSLGESIEDESAMQDLQDCYIHIGYWPTNVFEGTCFCIGGRFSNGAIPDLCLGISYSFRIYKGWYGTVGYRSGIMEIRTNRKLPLKGIRAGINYVF